MSEEKKYLGGLDLVDHSRPTLFGHIPWLTRRDLFAAMAMQGMLSNVKALKNYTSAKPLEETIAEEATTMADALIAELEKGEK